MKNLFLDSSCLKCGRVIVEGDYCHYLKNVRRIRSGDVVRAIIGGKRYTLRAAGIEQKAVAFDIVEIRKALAEGYVPIRVYQGLLRTSKMDLVVAKLSELTVEELVPLGAERSVSRAAAGRAERWARLAREGAKVTGIERLMRIGEPVSVGEAARLIGDAPGTGVFQPGPGKLRPLRSGVSFVFCPGPDSRARQRSPRRAESKGGRSVPPFLRAGGRVFRARGGNPAGRRRDSRIDGRLRA